MSRLILVTFADRPLSEGNYLRSSCEQHGITLKVLLCSPWIQNVVKLKLLYEYVQTIPPETVLLMADAYDVVCYADEATILDLFAGSQADILFSGESNFMYKEPARWFSSLLKYPKQRTIYQFLNSGTYIGKAKHILMMLEEIQARFDIDLLDEQKLIPLKSDQFLLHKLYLDFHQTPANGLSLGIDAHHDLMGCTGGRFCVIPLPDVWRWQAFSFFILERNILKLLKLHQHQKVPKDYISNGSRFYNKKTKTHPPVMHFPGTWDRFDKVYADLLANKKPAKNGSWIFAATVSLGSYVLSFFFGGFLSLINGRSTSGKEF